MAYTSPTMYTSVRNAALNTTGGPASLILDRLRGNYVFPDTPTMGVMTMPIVSAYTPTTSLTDGTMLTNGTNNTTASFTLSDNAVVDSRPPTDSGDFYTRPENYASVLLQMRDALAWQALDTYIEALISGSPTHSYTLTAGHADFASATTADIAKLTQAIVNTAKNRGGALGQLTVLMEPESFGNFMSYGANLINTGALLGNPELTAQGYGTIGGVPVFAIESQSASNWGAVSSPVAFVVHPDGAPLIMSPPRVSNDGPFDYGDGHRKVIMQAPFAYSVAQVALLGEVVNNSS